MQRNKSSPVKSSPPARNNSKTWVMLLKRDFLNIEGEKTPDIVKLRHPRSGLSVLFIFSSDNSSVCEVLSFSEKRSWFMNDSVREGGQLYISTPVDPLFLILPYLKKSKDEGKIIPLDDLLIDNKYPETCRLLNTSAPKYMHLLADRKGPEELNAWMYNEEKTMKWLCKKTENVTKVLKAKDINVRDSATSKNYIKVVKDDSEDREVHLRYAHEIISEYLSEYLSQKLLSSLGLPAMKPDELPPNKRKLGEMNVHNGQRKKMKVDDEVGTPSKPVKPQVTSAKEKTNAKAASGTKSIISFFNKK